MGTNYYRRRCATCGQRGQHIGKLSAAGGGETVFTWAIQPICLGEMGELENEYGDPISLKMLRELLERCATQEHSLIGQEFC